MAHSTYNTKLMVKSTSSYVKLVAIKDFPDLGGSPELIETTTLDNSSQTFVHGVQSMSALEFTANYTKTDYQSVSAYADNEEHEFQIQFGEDGAGGAGTFSFKGELAVWVVGGSVNSPLEMRISIAPSTEITFA